MAGGLLRDFAVQSAGHANNLCCDKCVHGLERLGFDIYL